MIWCHNQRKSCRGAASFIRFNMPPLIVFSACFCLAEEENFLMRGAVVTHTLVHKGWGDRRPSPRWPVQKEKAALWPCLVPFPFLFPGPPPPPPHIRVNEKDVLISKSSINFTVNCSWFSDTNGAVKYFAVVVREADGKSWWTNEPKTQNCLLGGHARASSMTRFGESRELNF